MKKDLKSAIKTELKPIKEKVKEVFDSEDEIFTDEEYESVINKLEKTIDSHTEDEIIVFLLMNLIDSEVLLNEG